MTFKIWTISPLTHAFFSALAPTLCACPIWDGMLSALPVIDADICYLEQVLPISVQPVLWEFVPDH